MHRALVVAAVLTGTLVSSGAQEAELGLSGYVLAPDEMPVTAGTVTLRFQGSQASTNIDGTGRFRIVPHVAGIHEMVVSAPGLMAHRVRVVVPASRTFMLPPIRLSPESYLHVRILSPSGEPLAVPWVARQSFDPAGTRIWEPNRADFNGSAPPGTTVVGPLPRGIATLAVDAPPHARTRLRDLRVTGDARVIDGGTVTLTQGAVLHVDVIDEAGAPVPDLPVFLDEHLAFSPVMPQPVRTDAKGRATFERLAAGRYHLRTRSVRPCGDLRLTIARSLDLPGAGTVRTRLVIGGTVTVRLTSGGVPLIATMVSLTPESPPPSRPAWFRERQGTPGWPFSMRLLDFSGETPCTGITDESGRLTLSSFPPGPARATVRLPHATWIQRLDVPARGRELALDVPSGFMSLRISSAGSHVPVGGARITWTSGGSRVEGHATSTGDALLDGVGSGPGTIAIQAAGYRPFGRKLAAPSDVLQEIPLEPTRPVSLKVDVVRVDGGALAGAVVEMTPDDPIEAGEVATTDSQGSTWFVDAPPGSVRLSARAAGHAASTVLVAAHEPGPVSIALSRGYRVIVNLGSDAGPAPYSIRVMTAEGLDIDDLLDAASNRIVDRSRRISLGPLRPGAYILELRGPAGTRRQRLRLENRDAHVTIE